MTPASNRLTAVGHPLAGQKMSGSEMVVQILADQGVDVIFGYSGGAILPTYDAVFRYNAEHLSLIHISEPTRHICLSRMPSSA